MDIFKFKEFKIVLPPLSCFTGLPCVQNLSIFEEDIFDIPMTVPKECSEDCLQLNVYTPSVRGSKTVMVFIYGGGFNSGM